MHKIWVNDESIGYHSTYDSFISLESIANLVSSTIKSYGEIRNVKIKLSYVNESGHGLDYESAYYNYNLSFDRIETDKEYLKRTKKEKSATELIKDFNT